MSIIEDSMDERQHLFWLADAWERCGGTVDAKDAARFLRRALHVGRETTLDDELRRQAKEAASPTYKGP